MKLANSSILSLLLTVHHEKRIRTMSFFEADSAHSALNGDSLPFVVIPVIGDMVTSYAVDDKNYFRVRLVCKAWKEFADKRCFHILAAMSEQNEDIPEIR
jgi:hypothetical protein